MRGLATTCVVVIALLGRTGWAGELAIAEPHQVRLVLVTPPVELESAVRAALAPWRVLIIVDPTEPPRDAASAALIAERYRADAVAWLEVSEMRVYQSGATELVARPASEIDEASAASLALTLKTLLRLPPLPPEPEPEPAPPAVVAVAPRPRGPPPWRLSAAAGVRLRSEGPEMRATIIMERRLGPISAAVLGSLGPGIDVTSADFRGTWSDTFGGVALLVPFTRGGWRIAGGVGVSLHYVAIDGEFQGNTDNPGDYTDYGLGVDGELGVSWTRGHFGVGVRACGSSVSFRDRFTTRGSNALAVSPAEGELGIAGTFAF